MLDIYPILGYRAPIGAIIILKYRYINLNYICVINEIIILNINTIIIVMKNVRSIISISDDEYEMMRDVLVRAMLQY